MSKYTVTPKRALSINFTERTLRRSIKATKHGQLRKSYIMNTYRFVTKPAGALIALAVLTLGTVGAYAAVNWFNGHVGVKTDGSVISLDLSSCKNAFLPGFPDNQDMRNVQFKVTGEPHISNANLKQALLTQCENDAVTDFYHSKAATKNVELRSSKIVAIGDNSLTLTYKFGNQTMNKTLRLVPGATFYNQGTAIQVSDLKVGQPVVFATPHQEAYIEEGTDPLQHVTTVLSVFVTQYDTALAPGNGKYNFSYEANNIMPLSMYNELHKK